MKYEAKHDNVLKLIENINRICHYFDGNVHIHFCSLTAWGEQQKVWLLIAI